nr:zinc finger, CCHC-type [Tanacetum cinerariifolium]
DWLYISLRVMHWHGGKPISRPRVVMPAAGTEEEQAKNFQWGLRKSTLNYLMCMSYTDVSQVANAARNYEILHERDDDDTERPDKRGVVIGINRPLSKVVTGATVIITTVMGLTGEVVVTTTAVATTTTLAVTTGIPVMDVTKETGVISPTDLPILVVDGGSVQLGDNGICTIKGTGKVKIQLHDGSSFILEDVRYVPGLRRSFISLGTLENEGYTVKMKMGIIKVIKGCRVMMTGIRLWKQK